jgi:dihydrofolate reductase
MSREGKPSMPNTESRVTIHMAASLDGFIARKDGRVDWMEISDEFAGGDTMDPGAVQAFLKTIDCYVMGSRTYETALNFEVKGFGWAYGDKPVFALVAICRGPAIPSSSTRAISRSS